MRLAIVIFILGLALAALGFHYGELLGCGMMIDFKTVEETERHFAGCRLPNWECLVGAILMGLALLYSLALWIKSKL